MELREQNILSTIRDAAEDKKGNRIRILDISSLTVVADYFVLISGYNTNQVQAIADHIVKTMNEQYALHTRQIEGYRNAGWILLDFGNIVVHVFDHDQRLFYDLDRIWSDAQEIMV